MVVAGAPGAARTLGESGTGHGEEQSRDEQLFHVLVLQLGGMLWELWKVGTAGAI